MASRYLPALAVCLLAACGTYPDPSQARKELMAADRAFDAAVATEGVEAWVSFFADSGMEVGNGGPFTVGHASIREEMAPVFADPALKLRWSPDTALVSTDASLGYTIGHWRRIRLSDSGETVLSRGRYLTVWRKQREGGWKVEADVGNETPAE